MSWTTIESCNTLCLVHWEGCSEKCCIVIVIQVKITTLAVELLTHIITGVHLRWVFQRSNSHLRNILHWKIHILPVMTIVGVAIILNLVGLIVRTTRVVHSHNKGTIKRTAHCLLVEFLWCIGLCLTNLLTILILESKGKGLHWLAQRKY